MKRQKMTRVLTYLTLLVSCLSVSAMAQSAKIEDSIAAIAGDATEIRWQPRVEYARIVLTVSTPDGEVFSKEFEAGSVPSFKLADGTGLKLPDGQYVYELRVIPYLSREVRKALAAAREKGNSDETVRELQRSGQLPTDSLVQSGGFSVKEGTVYFGGAEEPGNPKKPGDSGVSIQSPRQKEKGGFTILDQVIPDDLIVQGSACVGLDCVNNETFGFDTIRMKENNTRLQFDDTSTAAGFPTNNWQIRANSSANGGTSFLGFVDQGATGNSETGTIVFSTAAGAPANSLFVSSTGRVGLRTGTPVLDLHITTGNTPAHRLEQTSAGGFTAQTWDVAGNEANFFVRDVTGGSRLPFRIRPGAPTSSIDIAASGDVGIGTASPARKLELSGTGNVGMKITRTDLTNAAFLVYVRSGDGTLAGRQFSILDENAGADRVIINSSGFIGIGGLLNPTNPLEHANGARLTAGGVWTDASSRALKTNIRSLTASEAFRALPRLSPVKFEYKAEPGETYAGFIAEDVPELVATGDRKTLSSMDVVAVLTRVVQEQQKTITELKAKMARLEKRVTTPARFKSRNSRQSPVR